MLFTTISKCSRKYKKFQPSPFISSVYSCKNKTTHYWPPQHSFSWRCNICYCYPVSNYLAGHSCYDKTANTFMSRSRQHYWNRCGSVDFIFTATCGPIIVFGCCIVHASRRPQYTPVINPSPTQPPTTPEPDPISATIEEPSPQQTGTKDAEKDVNPAPEYETSIPSSTSQVAVLFCN